MSDTGGIYLVFLLAEKQLSSFYIYFEGKIYFFINNKLEEFFVPIFYEILCKNLREKIYLSVPYTSNWISRDSVFDNCIFY